MEKQNKILLDIESFWNPGCPVILKKGTLLEDTMNGTEKLQLKFLNNSCKKILVLKIEIIAKDNLNCREHIVSYSYTDVNTAYGNSFGSQEEIIMPASQCIDFSFVVKEVFFEDGSMYESGEILKELDVPSKTIYS